MLTEQRLKECLFYNWITGLFTWKISVSKKIKAGDFAGCFDRYVQIKIDGHIYLAHRLAWLYVYGVWPVEIDHKDTVKHHNWITNLREVTRSENQQNKIKAKENNKTGLLGVSYCESRDRYVAQIKLNGKVKNLGRFDTAEEAHVAYLTAKRQLHSACTL